MTVSTIIFGTIALAAVLGFMGMLGGSGLRGVARALLGLMVLAFGALTLACLYGSVALSDRGGAVLIFLALPAGLLTWIAMVFFSSVGDTGRFARMTPGEQRAYADTQFDAVRDSLEQSIAHKRKRLQGFWLRGAKRRSLQASLAAEESLLRETAMLERRYRESQGGSSNDDAETGAEGIKAG